MSQEEMSFGHQFQRLKRMLDGDDALLPCDNMREVMPDGPDDYPTLFVTLEEEPDQAVRFWLDRVDTVWGEQGVRVILRLPAGVWLYTTEHDRQMPTHTLQWCHLRMSTAVPTRPAGLGGLALIAMHAARLHQAFCASGDRVWSIMVDGIVLRHWHGLGSIDTQREMQLECRLYLTEQGEVQLQLFGLPVGNVAPHPNRRHIEMG